MNRRGYVPKSRHDRRNVGLTALVKRRGYTNVKHIQIASICYTRHRPQLPRANELFDRGAIDVSHVAAASVDAITAALVYVDTRDVES